MVLPWRTLVAQAVSWSCNGELRPCMCHGHAMAIHSREWSSMVIHGRAMVMLGRAMVIDVLVMVLPWLR